MAYEIEQYLNVRSASAPSYSPDGQRIAFVSNLTGIPLSWVVPASGGWPHPLSLATERTGQVVFSPSGQHVSFDRDHGGDEHWQLLVCNPEGGAVRPFTFDPDVSHRFGQWSPDSDFFSFASNAIERRRFDVYIQALDGDAPRLVYSGEESAEPVSWTPDGTRLIVQQGARSESTDLYMVDAASGDAVHLTPHDGEAAYHLAGFSANGRTLYLRTDQSQEFLGLARLGLRDGNLEFDLVSDWDVESAALSPNKRRMVYSKTVDGASEITLRDLRSAEEYPTPGLSPPRRGFGPHLGTPRAQVRIRPEQFPGHVRHLELRSEAAAFAAGYPVAASGPGRGRPGRITGREVPSAGRSGDIGHPVRSLGRETRQQPRPHRTGPRGSVGADTAGVRAGAPVLRQPGLGGAGDQRPGQHGLRPDL